MFRHKTGYPIIGNLLDLPREQAYLKFKELGELYGPIFKLDIFGLTHVVICQQKIADDLLSRKGRIYSDRGNLHMGKLVTGGGDLLANGQNDYWRRGRKLADAMMTSAMASQWEPWQAQEAKRMVVDMLKDPGRYGYWFERFSTLVSLREIYGTIPKTEDEECYHTKRILTRMHNLERVATPGAYLVEIIPILMYLPEFLAPF
jgi:cytochrome P450